MMDRRAEARGRMLRCRGRIGSGTQMGEYIGRASHDRLVPPCSKSGFDDGMAGWPVVSMNWVRRGATGVTLAPNQADGNLNRMAWIARRLLSEVAEIF